MRMRWTILALTLLASIARAQEQDDPLKEFDRLCMFDHLFSKEEVGPDFSLKISFHHAPVEGARIELEHGGKAVATARTNSRGVAIFSAIPPGEYSPRAVDGLVFPVGSLVLEVKPGHAVSEKVKLDWPGYSVATQNLRGKFTVSEQLDDPDMPLRNTSVELLDPYTSKLIESGHTDVNGDYEFATRIPGVYALRLTLAKKDESGSETRDLPVELDPGAKAYSIPEMKAVHSDCYGLQLLRRSGTEDRWEAQ